VVLLLFTFTFLSRCLLPSLYLLFPDVSIGDYIHSVVISVDFIVVDPIVVIPIYSVVFGILSLSLMILLLLYVPTEPLGI